MTREGFGELRSLLQRPPDEASWGWLCGLLDTIPWDRLEAEILPYVSSLLTSWPDVVRVAPWRWLEELRAGRTHPGLTLARTLDVRGRKLRYDQFELLAASPFMAEVRHIYLQDNRAGPTSLAALLTPEATRNLEVLHLDGNPLGDDGARALAKLEVCSRLVDLSLDRTSMSDEGVRALLEDGTWSSLKALELGGNLLGRQRANFEAWALAPLMARLERLSLQGSIVMRPRHARALAGSGLTAMRVLELDGLELRYQELEALLSTDVAPGLEVLRLDWCKVGPRGAAWLARRPESRALRGLDLRRNVIEDAGAVALATSPYLEDLRRVWLGHNGIGEAGRRALEEVSWAVVW